MVHTDFYAFGTNCRGREIGGQELAVGRKIVVVVLSWYDTMTFHPGFLLLPYVRSAVDDLHLIQNIAPQLNRIDQGWL